MTDAVEVTGGAGSYAADIEDMKSCVQVLQAALVAMDSARENTLQAARLLQKHKFSFATLESSAEIVNVAPYALHLTESAAAELQRVIKSKDGTEHIRKEMSSISRRFNSAIFQYLFAEARAKMYSPWTIGMYLFDWIKTLAGPLKILIDVPVGVAKALTVYGLYSVKGILTGELDLVRLSAGDRTAHLKWRTMNSHFLENYGAKTLADALVPIPSLEPVWDLAGMGVTVGGLLVPRNAVQVSLLGKVPTSGEPTNNVADALRVLDKTQPTNGGTPGTIAVERFLQSNGTKTFMVAIPGTQTFGFDKHNPNDLQSIAQAYRGKPTPTTAQVREALTALGATQADNVVLVGHSLGGINAVNMANDKTFTNQFNLKAVVTAGSPVAHLKTPADVELLHLEHLQDEVTSLDLGKPDAHHNRTVVSVDMARVQSHLNTTYSPHDVNSYVISAQEFVDGVQDGSRGKLNETFNTVWGDSVVKSEIFHFQAVVNPPSPPVPLPLIADPSSGIVRIPRGAGFMHLPATGVHYPALIPGLDPVLIKAETSGLVIRQGRG